MAKVTISDSEAFKDFDMKHNRHLNMLQDTVSILFLFLISTTLYRTETLDDKP